MPDSIFAKIVRHEIPAEIIYEDNDYLAFLSIEPHNPGHTVVVPKQATTGNFWDMPPGDLAEFIVQAQKIAKILMQELKPKRIALLFEGFGVSDYVHINLIPINKPGDVDHTKARAVTPEELAVVATKLRQAIKNGFGS